MKFNVKMMTKRWKKYLEKQMEKIKEINVEKKIKKCLFYFWLIVLN